MPVLGHDELMGFVRNCAPKMRASLYLEVSASSPSE